ncbi:uroporphyrinogen decarboxylase family protein [Candidatus Zixiibacteriota bacterium]
MVVVDAYDRWRALKSGTPADRPPISFWRHFYDQENSPESFIEATIGFQRRFDWDLVKINPKAGYHIEPWGVKIEPSKTPLDKPTKTDWPVHRSDDLAKIRPLTVSHDEFSAQLKSVSAIRRAFSKPLPIVMTMFSPLSVLGDLVPDNETLVGLISKAPGAVTVALENITKTFSDLAVEFLNAGADGLFFATTEWASSDLLTWAQYEEFGRPYDLQVLNAISGEATFTILHVCASNNYLEKFAGYPVDVINWDATDPTNLPLREGWHALNKPIMGGIDRYRDLLDLPPDTLADKTRKMVQAHADLPFAVGPGCAVPVIVPLENLEVVKNATIKSMKNS